jgi:hypothetical protein
MPVTALPFLGSVHFTARGIHAQMVNPFSKDGGYAVRHYVISDDLPKAERGVQKFRRLGVRDTYLRTLR